MIDKTKKMKALPNVQQTEQDLPLPFLLAEKEESVKEIMKILTYKNSKDQLPRDDYRESLELALWMLGETPPRGFHLQGLGPTHHARWMSSLLYVPKMYGFSDQIEDYDSEMVQKLEDIVMFTSLVYCKYWINAPNGRDAPVLDLQLYNDLLSLSSFYPDIAEVTLTVLARHTWYLTQEVVIFAMCSGLITNQEKEDIATKVLNYPRPTEFNPGKPTLPTLSPHMKLSDFVGQNSWLLLVILRLEGHWLNQPAAQWKDIPEFLKFEEYVVHTKVVNDTAERAIKLWSDYLNILTTDEMKREGLVQVVEDHRKRVKGRNKSVAWEGIKF